MSNTISAPRCWFIESPARADGRTPRQSKTVIGFLAFWWFCSGEMNFSRKPNLKDHVSQKIGQTLFFMKRLQFRVFCTFWVFCLNNSRVGLDRSFTRSMMTHVWQAAWTWSSYSPPIRLPRLWRPDKDPHGRDTRLCPLSTAPPCSRWNHVGAQYLLHSLWR